MKTFQILTSHQVFLLDNSNSNISTILGFGFYGVSPVATDVTIFFQVFNLMSDVPMLRSDVPNSHIPRLRVYVS